ncbi:MAG: VgrG-related protein [Ilumatobacteraceae bacterium]
MAQHSSNAFQIQVDGTDLAPDVASTLVEAFVEDEVNLPDAFELVFRDPLRTVLASGKFGIGKSLKISVVSESARGGTPIFDCEITALEAEIERDRTVAIVRGFDQAHRLQRGTTTETHLDVTYGDIAGKVAQRRGLQKGEAGTNTVVHEAVVQWNQTDWEFLSGLAAEIGHELVVVDSRLHLRPPGDSASGPAPGDLRSEDARQLVAGSNLLRLRATLSGAEQVTEVEVRGWDYKTKEAVKGSAKAADASRGASSGAGAATLAKELDGGVLVKADLPIESNETAQDAADSLIEQLGSAAAELDGVAAGDPALRAGVTVSLAGVGDTFNGKYVLTSCRHTYDSANGYQTAFRVSGRQTRTMLGLVRGHGARAEQQAVRGVVPALVSNIDDPDSLGRVKVSFPWLADNAESHWARVASAGAGNERGVFSLPEVGDEVLVAFDHGDPRLPYVVGGLYNGKDKPPVVAVDNGKVVKRAIVSRNGHKIELDDKDDVMTIVTGDGKHRLVIDQKGSKVVLETTGDVEVTSKKKLSISANDGITMESQGTFEVKATGVTIDAGGGAFSAKGSQAKVEGSGTAEISSSGQTTVRGSMVSIN